MAKLDAAPVDDEELTDEDRRTIQEAREEPGITWSEVEAELNAAESGDRRIMAGLPAPASIPRDDCPLDLVPERRADFVRAVDQETCHSRGFRTQDESTDTTHRERATDLPSVVEDRCPDGRDADGHVFIANRVT
jgi:hypothetical protein